MPTIKCFFLFFRIENGFIDPEQIKIKILMAFKKSDEHENCIGLFFFITKFDKQVIRRIWCFFMFCRIEPDPPSVFISCRNRTGCYDLHWTFKENNVCPLFFQSSTLEIFHSILKVQSIETQLYSIGHDLD